MKISKLDEYTKGWIVGDFTPSLFNTKDFEFGIKKYAKGDQDDIHFHKIASEITVVVTGSFLVNEKILNEGDVFTMEPGEVSDFKCLEEGYTAVIKFPSVKNDKYIIE